MKVVIDEKIPYLGAALEKMGHEVLALPGVAISRSDLAGAEALFVRTRTKCDASLLDGTPVRFIGTATIGYDHIDAAYCAAHSIHWTNAAGCNADAVLQYVQSAVYAWAREKGVALGACTLGVVGVGEIGSRVARWAESAGLRLLLNDPPRAMRGESGFVSLSQIASRCDIITFHTTLVKDGACPSYHLADEAFFSSLEKCRLLINASRGAVVDNAALLDAMERNSSMDVVLDVWENEPDISLPLLNKVYMATPHIAGYSAEGKMNATRMVLEDFARFFGSEDSLPQLALSAPSDKDVVAASMPDALLQIYSLHGDSATLKAHPEMFEKLRNDYKLRREPASYNIRIVSESPSSC